MYFYVFLLLCSSFLCMGPGCWPVSFPFCLRSIRKPFQARLVRMNSLGGCFPLPSGNLYFSITFFSVNSFSSSSLNFYFVEKFYIFHKIESTEISCVHPAPKTCVTVNTTQQRAPLLPGMQLPRPKMGIYSSLHGSLLVVYILWAWTKV